MPSKEELKAQTTAAKAALPPTPLHPSPPLETEPTSWSALSWRSWKGLVALWKSGSWAKLLITSVAFLALAVLALVYLPVSKILPQANPTLGPTAQELGMIAIWTGSYTDVENQRLKAQIRNAKSIKFMAYNADQFIQNFSPDLAEFFSRGDTSMQVLLADPHDPFYIDNTKFTLGRNLEEKEVASYQQHLEDAVSRLRSLERVKGQQVELRLFKNQLRAPIIIIDDKVCILTVKLPPFESRESLRIEFDNSPLSFNSKCITHFNQLWSLFRDSSRIINKP